MHPIQALLQTLLPWVNAGEAPDYDVQDTAEEDGADHSAGQGAAPQDEAVVGAGQQQHENGTAAASGAAEDYADYAFESDEEEEPAAGPGHWQPAPL